MKSICLYTFIILFPISISSQNIKIKSIKKHNIEDLSIHYNPKALKIPGKKFKIGLNANLKNGKEVSTKGFLNGTLRWMNFRIIISDGFYRNGKIFLNNSPEYKKEKFFIAKIYKRKDKTLIKEFRIPYNFETSLQIFTNNNFSKAPGSFIDFGLRTQYDNSIHQDYRPGKTAKLYENFEIITDGGAISKGKFFINSDPFSIINHKVSLTAKLRKYNEIGDSFTTTLDYKKYYNYYSEGQTGESGESGENGRNGNIGSNGGNGAEGGYGYKGYDGYNLELYATGWYDTIIDEELLYVQVTNLHSFAVKDYFINTNGGRIRITSQGGTGGSGGYGGNGGDGGRGFEGKTYKTTSQTRDSTIKIITKQKPGGNGGHGGNGAIGGDGANGGNGGNIFLYYTKYASDYLHLIQLETPGGNGGSGGYGGYAGAGGQGGSGSPNGAAGSSGSRGSNGESGFRGYMGRIERHLIKETTFVGK